MKTISCLFILILSSLAYAQDTCYQAQNAENLIILTDSGVQERAQISLLKFTPLSGVTRLELSAQSKNLEFSTLAFRFSSENSRYGVECDGGGVDIAKLSSGNILLKTSRMTGMVNSLTTGCSSGMIQIQDVIYSQVSCNLFVSK